MTNYLLSIDGSTTGTGWAIIDKNTLNLIDYGVFKKSKEEESIMRNRVIYMIDGLNKVIEKYSPNEIVMEEVIPMINNGYTVLALGILSGGVLGIAHARNIPIKYIPVATWHTALNFYDGTTKGKQTDNMKQMSIEFANKKYGLNLIYKSKSSKFNSDNESDAICIGCYHLDNYDKKKQFGRK
jgi:Holliday junction resolvasome RuvABC endonuclease subunit